MENWGVGELGRWDWKQISVIFKRMKYLASILILCSVGVTYSQQDSLSRARLREESDSWMILAEDAILKGDIETACKWLDRAKAQLPNERSAQDRYLELVLGMRTDTIFADESSFYLRPLFRKHWYRNKCQYFPALGITGHPQPDQFGDSLYLVKDSTLFNGVVSLNKLALPEKSYRTTVVCVYKNGLLQTALTTNYKYTITATAYDTVDNVLLNPVHTYGEPHWKSSETYHRFSGDRGTRTGVTKTFYANGQVSFIDSVYRIDSVRYSLTMRFLRDGRLSERQFFRNRYREGERSREGEQFYLWTGRDSVLYEVRQIWKNDTLTDVLNDNVIYIDEHGRVLDKRTFIRRSQVTTYYNGYTFNSYIPVPIPDEQFDFIVSMRRRQLDQLNNKQLVRIVRSAHRQQKT
jgi:hypothetical protein